MSTQRKAEFAEEKLSENAICDYLEAHLDFFENHKTVLSRMQLPHASGGTVSLVERQISLLRQKDLKLERQLKELIQVAAVVVSWLEYRTPRRDQYHEVLHEVSRTE